MIATGQPLRRRARLLMLHCLRGCRRHYASAVSFGVLGVALAFALTSTSFSGGSDEPAADPPASSVRPLDVFSITAPVASDPRVTYYLYEDEAERELLQGIVRSDVTYLERQGLPNTIGEVHFLRVADETDELYVSFLLNQGVSLAATNGVKVNIVDLRVVH